MSEEQLKAFIAKVKGDSSLQEKLKAAKSQDDVVSIAKDHGHEFTTEDLERPKSTLSDEALEAISGGGGTAPPICSDGCYEL